MLLMNQLFFPFYYSDNPLYEYIKMFIHCPIDAHLVCFQFWAIVNKLVMNMPLDIFLCIILSFLWETTSTIAGSGACLYVLGNSKRFSKRIASCYTSTSNTWVLHLLSILNVFNFSPFGGM